MILLYPATIVLYISDYLFERQLLIWKLCGVWWLFISGGSRICQRVGADHGERVEREPKRGSGGGAPSGVQGQSPWWGVRGGEAPLKLKAFCTFLHKKWPKVKDLSENLPPCVSRAAKASPKFWSMGGGRPPWPPIARSATVQGQSS